MEKKSKEEQKVRTMLLRRGTVLLLFLGVLGFAVTVCLSTDKTAERKALYHYETRRDLSVYFGNADIVIEDIRAALRRRQERIVISYSSHSDNMKDLGIIADELFEYALSETAEPDEGDYMRYQIGGYDLDYSYEEADGEYSYRLVLTPDYYSSQEEEQKVDEAVRDIIESFGFDSQTGDYEKIKAVFDWVCKNVRYDPVKSRLGSSHYKSSAYGALFYKNAVCQGYSVLMYRLLRECGISCRIVTGIAEREGESELHAWNIAELDGRYYNIDASWCSQLGTEDYFLKSDEDMEGHTKDEKFLTEEFCEDFQISKVSFN